MNDIDVLRPVAEAFVDCFGGTVLRDVDALFRDLGFSRDPRAEESSAASGRGARRSRAAGYVATLDLVSSKDVDRLLKAIGWALTDWQPLEDKADWGELKRLRRNLNAAGYEWDGHRIVPPARVAAAAFIERLTEIEDVDQEVGRILGSVDEDPADAITAARSLVETACKSVLDELGQEFDDHDDLPNLYKKTALALNIDATQHEVVYRQTLQGLMSAVQGIAELRNKLGDAHGMRRAGARAQPRHARMAAGAAMTVATFLVETMVERRQAAEIRIDVSRGNAGVSGRPDAALKTS